MVTSPLLPMLCHTMGLVEGQYDGVDATKGPRGKISKSYWSVSEMVDYVTYSGGMYFLGDYNNCLFINSYDGIARATIPFLNPADAWSIDTKTDDGMPATGKSVVFTRGLNLCTNAVSSSTLTAQYLLSDSRPNRCEFAFRNQF